MAVNILIGKSRHQSRSDREREKLQAQISTYAVRFHQDRDAEERRAFERRLQVEPPTVRQARDLEDFISSVARIVERVMPCTKCHHNGAHELSCPELRVVVGVPKTRLESDLDKPHPVVDAVLMKTTALILFATLFLCGRGFSQSIDCEKLASWHEVCKFSDGNVTETISGDSYSQYEWTGAEARKVWSQAVAHRIAERKRHEQELKRLQQELAELQGKASSTTPKTKGGSLKETTQRMCEDAVEHNKPLPSYCAPK